MATIGTIRYRNGSSWVDILHPVGSFYFSTQSTSPSSLFGGTWIQITNAAIRGATATGYTGSDSTTLTISQIPAHQHNSSGTWLAQSIAGGGAASGFNTYWGTGNLGYNTSPSRGGGGCSHKHSTFLQLFCVVSFRLDCLEVYYNAPQI